MKRFIAAIGILAFALVLTACPGGAKPATQAQFNQSVTSARDGATTSVSDVSQKLNGLRSRLHPPVGMPSLLGHDPIQVLQDGLNLVKLDPKTLSLDPAKLFKGMRDWARSSAQARLGTQAVTVTQLERGVYDCTSGTCLAPTASSNLEVRWMTAETIPQLVVYKVNWTVNALPTVTQWDNGSYSEVPQKAQLTLEVSGIRFAEVNFAATWRVFAGTPDPSVTGPVVVLTPTNLSLSGFLKDETTADVIRLNNFSLGFSATTLSTAMDVVVTDEGTNNILKWNVVINGAATFDANGNFSDITPGGSTPSNFDLTINALNIKFKASNWVYDGGTNLVSVDLSQGSITVGADSVTFSGTLDDSNHNCVPGENVTIVYSDGTSSLETLLISEDVPTGSCPAV